MSTFDTYWLAWTLLAAGSFALLEAWAIKRKAPGTRTLSQVVWRLRPIWRVLIGAFLIWLFLHWEFPALLAQGTYTVTPVVDLPVRTLPPYGNTQMGTNAGAVDVIQTANRCIFVARSAHPSSIAIVVTGKVNDGCL